MTATPLVSIITPARNAARYLAETVESVRAQDWPAVEHIVIDDGSTDSGATTAVLARYPHLRAWSRENRGQYATMNEGLRAARGTWVLFLSADDLLAPHAIRQAMATAHRHPAAQVIYGRWRKIDPDGRPLPVQTQLSGRLPRRLFVYLDHISHCALFARREALLSGEHSFDESVRYTGDAIWIQRLIDAGLPMRFVDAVLAEYRVHPAQTVQRAGRQAIEAEQRRYVAAAGASWRLVQATAAAERWRSRALKAACILRTGGPPALIRTARGWQQRRRT